MATEIDELDKIIGRDAAKKIAEGNTQSGTDAQSLPIFRTNRFGQSRGVGDFGRIFYTIPRVGLPPESPRQNIIGRETSPFRQPVGGGVPMESVFRWENEPGNRRLFEEREAAWIARAAEVGGKQIEARRAALDAYRTATPQERMMLAPELRAQFDSEILAEKAAQTGAVAQSAAVRKMDQARQASTRVRANDMSEKAESISKANQAALRLWANKPSMPPPIDRPSPIRGGGFFVDPDYRRLLQDKAQKLNAWTSAAATVEAQKRKLLNRAVSEPDEE